MMAAQLIAAHNAAMECYRRAMIGEQTFEGRRENLAQANKLSRTYATLLEALGTLRPEAVVFTEPASARGHAIRPESLAALYGAGAQVARPASAAVDLARALAGPAGNVLVGGSLYLVGEVLSLKD